LNQSGKKLLRTDNTLIREIERHAVILRQQIGIGLMDRLNPREWADKLNIQIAYPDEIEQLTHEIRQRLLGFDAKVWSGISNTLPGGQMLIILNPNQTAERENVTIMEEVAHNYYGHQPSQLNRIGRDRYDEETEREAYWTAAAALLPSKVVGQAVWRGESAAALAARYGTSVELAEMRIKTLNLWSCYKKEEA
jgi:IrrE N-terminal-like domain